MHELLLSPEAVAINAEPTPDGQHLDCQILAINKGVVLPCESVLHYDRRPVYRVMLVADLPQFYARLQLLETYATD